MMKKLFFMMLVIGVASAATAGLSFSVSEGLCNLGETVTVDLISDGGASTSYVGYYANPGDSAAITGVAALKGNMTSVNPVSGYAGFYQVVVGSTDPLSPINAGDVVASISLTALNVGIYEIYLYAGDWETQEGSIQSFYMFAPEPASMCLLGLGGLFLRRRR